MQTLAIVTGPLAHPREVYNTIFIVIYFYHVIMAHKMYNVLALWTFSSTCGLQDILRAQFHYESMILIHRQTEVVFAIAVVMSVLGTAVCGRSMGGGRQGSEVVYSEVCSQRGRAPQSPGPPAIPYFSQAGVTVL